jgi:hypothetical protein
LTLPNDSIIDLSFTGDDIYYIPETNLSGIHNLTVTASDCAIIPNNMINVSEYNISVEECPAPAGGGGGGGRACAEDWTCSGWTDCIGGERTRDCSDLNRCGTTVQRPELGEACTVVLPAPTPTPAPILPAPPTTIIPGPTILEQLLNNPAFYIGSGALIAAIARLFFLLKRKKGKKGGNKP